MPRKSNQAPTHRQRVAAADKKTAKRSGPDDASALKATKQQRIVDFLDQPDGTTVAAIMKATAWQRHSVRGFLAGIVRKKLGLTLVSEKVDDRRVYRVHAGKPAGSKSPATTPTPSGGWL